MRNRDELSVMADIITENVSAQDVAAAMGWEVRHGRCRCPIHNGGDFNCVMYKGNRGFYCHVCKTGGSVLKLAQSVMPNLSFPDILRWFDSTFSLNLNIDRPMDKRRLKSAKNSLKRKREDRAFRDRVERMDFDMYCLLGVVLNRLEQQRDQNRPRRYGEEWNDQFCDAVRLIPEVTDAIEYFAIQSTAVRK